MHSRTNTFFPDIKTHEEMQDVFILATWFFARLSDVQVIFLVEDNNLQSDCLKVPGMMGDDIHELLPEMMMKSSFLTATKWQHALEIANVVMLWRHSAHTVDIETFLVAFKVFSIDMQISRMRPILY